MRLPTVLILLLAALAVAGAAWLFLDASPVAVETWDDDPFPESTSDVTDEPERPALPRRTAVVELPVEEETPRVAVLAAGTELPPHGAADPTALNALHEASLGASPAGMGGAELVQAIGKVAYVRFRSQADLDAVERLGPDPDWPPDPEFPLMEVLEHWRRAGFEVDFRGQYLLVVRRDE